MKEFRTFLLYICLEGLKSPAAKSTTLLTSFIDIRSSHM